MKFLENCQKILKKLKRNWKENCKWYQENYENIIGKNWSNKKFFWNNSVKLGKNYEKILENLEKMWEILRTNLKEKNFDEIFEVIFGRTREKL